MRTDEAGSPASPVWDPSTRRLAAIAVVVLVVALGVFFLFGVLDSIIIAALLAFLIEPLLRWAVNRLHAPRWLALTITYLLIAAIAFGAVLFLPILLIESIAQIDFSGIIADIDAWLADLAASLEASGFLGIDFTGISAVGDAASQGETGGGLLDPGALLGAFESALVAAAGLVGVVVSVVSSIFFVLIISVYLSVDSERLLRPLPRLVAGPSKFDVLELGRRLNRVWSDYIRGESIMMIVIGFTTFVVTWLIGVPGALFLGVIAGLLEVIPTFGPIISTIPAVLIALFQGSTRFDDMNNFVFALVVIAAYILIQQLESNIIQPKVMGTTVKIPPILVLISITAAYQVVGILGAILAVPVVASAKVVLGYLWAKVHSRDPWALPADEPEGEVLT
jgi:predicted PurR-regulated permease PerM